MVREGRGKYSPKRLLDRTDRENNRGTFSQERPVGYPLRTMHDLGYFRENLDVFADMAKRRGITFDLDGFRALDKERRECITANEQRKAQRNAGVSKVVLVH